MSGWRREHIWHQRFNLGEEACRIRPKLSNLSRLEEFEFPSDDVFVDLLEFSYESIGEPNAYEYHSYFRHEHYSFNQGKGREVYTQEVNRIFERCGIAYELREGEITRLAPAILHEALGK